MQCPHAQHSICQIATRLANRPVTLDLKACAACLRDPVPMAINRVTAAIAAHSQRKAGIPVDPALNQMAKGVYHLAGYRVERQVRKWLKRLGIIPPADCGCEGWVAKMNAWGIAGSLEHIDEITDAVYENLKKTYLSAISIAVITKPLIRRSIRKWLLSAHL